MRYALMSPRWLMPAQNPELVVLWGRLAGKELANPRRGAALVALPSPGLGKP